MTDRKLKPSSIKEIRIEPPELSIFTLSNGIQVYFIQKTELPIVRLTTLINCGSRLDPENLKGLANLTSMCIDEGAGGLSAIELADEFELLGTNLSIFTDEDFIQVSMQTLSENFEPALKLFCKVIESPALSENEFEKEKNKLSTTLLQLKDNPDYIANVAFEYHVFGKNHPYAYPSAGIRSYVNKISINDVKLFYKKNFTPKNSKFIIVGNIKENTLVNLLESNFGNWDNNEIKNSYADYNSTANSNLYIVNKPGSVQTEIRIGFAAGKRNNENYFRRLLLNTILGGQFSSRINLNLREKHGYTYGAHSSISYSQFAGIFSVATSVSIENSVAALEQIFYELGEIRNGVTQSETEFAKDTLTKRFPLNFETYGQLSQNLRTIIAYNLPYSYFSEYVPSIKKINKDEIDREAKTFINPDLMTNVLVCDKTKIDFNQLDKFGWNIKSTDYENLFIS